jgi:exodeoxyribonuclease V alpha subunit
MEVSFEGRQVEYDFGDLDEPALAYVLSIHRSQDSEFPCMVIPLLTRHSMVLQRNLLYTAVTRGKEMVVLVGTKKALGMAVRAGGSPPEPQSWAGIRRMVCPTWTTIRPITPCFSA